MTDYHDPMPRINDGWAHSVNYSCIEEPVNAAIIGTIILTAKQDAFLGYVIASVSSILSDSNRAST